MNTENITHIAEIERMAQELGEQVRIIDQHLMELEQLKMTLQTLRTSSEDEFLSPLGNRVFIKAKTVDKKKLFVDVGAGIVLKKTPEETLHVINENIVRLREVRVQLGAQLEGYYQELESFVNQHR